jgi:hypothetical protein
MKYALTLYVSVYEMKNAVRIMIALFAAISIQKDFNISELQC